MNEPKTLAVGDTAEWTFTLADYPASIWTLHYSLFNLNNAYAFDAVVSGDDHVVNLLPSVTSNWAPGRYDWTAYVTNVAGDRQVVAQGVITLTPDPSAGVPYDGRSHARKMLEALEALLENRATSADLDMIRGTYADRTIERQPEKLTELRDKYKAEVAVEDREVAIKRGENVPRGVKVRFT
jgi:hypothetical protein